MLTCKHFSTLSFCTVMKGIKVPDFLLEMLYELPIQVLDNVEIKYIA